MIEQDVGKGVVTGTVKDPLISVVVAYRLVGELCVYADINATPAFVNALEERSIG